MRKGFLIPDRKKNIPSKEDNKNEKKMFLWISRENLDELFVFFGSSGHKYAHYCGIRTIRRKELEGNKKIEAFLKRARRYRNKMLNLQFDGIEVSENLLLLN